MEFRNKVVENPGRYRLVRVEGEEDVFDLVRTEGLKLDAGTQINQNFFDEFKKEILESVYQVGDIYISANEANPALIFGGEWERFSEGGFLLGSGSGYTAGQTGGEKAVGLSEAEMPAHSHCQYLTNANYAYEQVFKSSLGQPGTLRGVMNTGTYIEDAATYVHTKKAGSGAPHNNMPPYTVVNIWRKTA